MAAYLTHITHQVSDASPVRRRGGLRRTRPRPRDELVCHLLEYKRYKEAAETLGGAAMLERDVFAREPVEEPLELSQQPLNVSMADLLEAFRGLIARTARRDLIELEPDRLLVKDKINEILKRFARSRLADFRCSVRR